MPDDEDIPPPDSPPSDEERAQAAQLRDALEDPSRAHQDAELARALSAAWSPRELTTAEHRALVEQALARRDAAGRRGDGVLGFSRGKVFRVTFGASAALAVAAAVLLVVWSGKRPPSPRAIGPATSARASVLAASRSTQALFSERFAPTGGETARIDRIAVARAADLRDNEFAKWGVR
jgi:hypothetical protein